MNRRISLVVFGLLVVSMLAVWSSLAHEGEHHSEGGNGQPGDQPLTPLGFTPCVNGMAGTFPCNRVDLASLLPIDDIDGTTATGVTSNDIWGWTDPQTGKEYALLGLSNSVAFVDVSDAEHPVYLGNLFTHSVDSLWRGMKVYRNHLFVVSEALNHGMQVFDLTRLRGVATPQAFTETAFYDGVSTTHTIAINEETGYAYLAGTRPGTGKTIGVNTCGGRAQGGGGLHVVDVRNPAAPVFAGCVDADGYTHEAQCVIYRGPDAAHHGREVCFSANEDTLTIVDVTNKAAPVQLSRTTYAGRGYTHQGWLTDDHTRFLLDDELDEQNNHTNTRTFVWNISNLDAPSVQNIYQGPSGSIDHNLYVRGLYAFESNYRSGVRVVDLHNVATGNLTEAAFFDVYPIDDQALFNGTWGNYPFFASGIVIASGMEQGLFVLRPQLSLPVHIDYEPYFVRQHYRDFLLREPDEPGLAFWSHEIAACMADRNCTETRRINTSAAFFLSIEFQGSGYFVHRMYKAAYGNLPNAPVPLRREEFLPDTQRIGQNVFVGTTGWEQRFNANKDAYAAEFAARTRFTTLYQGLSNEQFVDALNNNTGGALSTTERNALVDDLVNNRKTRAQVLRAVAEDADLVASERNRAFVLSQYFGYLQRNPNEGRDTDYTGYNFWLGKLNEHNGNHVDAEMVKSFIISEEYRTRFGNR